MSSADEDPSLLPSVSVVMCTRNRAAQLGPALEALARVEHRGGWDIVVVDNGSTDDTRTRLEAAARDAVVPFRITLEPRPGLSRARNRGLSVTSGDVVAFIDDDCYAEPDFVGAIARCFTRPEVGFAGGRVLLHDPADSRITVQEHPEPFDIAPGEFIRSGRIHGANMAFRRAPLIELRGFDERLGAGSRFRAAEDSDAQRRMSLAGWTGAYDPRIVVRHHHGRRGEGEVSALLAGYDRGIGACMSKYLVNRSTRSAYARGWYWKMREIGARRRLRQLAWALAFVLLHGPTPSRLMRHPADSLDAAPDRGETSRTGSA